MAALRQALVLQVRELEDPRHREGTTADQPRPGLEPRRGVHRVVHGVVAEKGERAEPRPDGGVPGEERGTHQADALLTAARRLEQPDQRQARGQHHRRHHRLPRQQEEQEGGPERRAALDECVMVERPGGAGCLRSDREQPAAGDRCEHDAGDARPCTLERRSERGHPACSIFHSDWIAFLPWYSHVIPYCGRFTLLTLALARNAGDPGTVEKTEFCSVVMLPS